MGQKAPKPKVRNTPHGPVYVLKSGHTIQMPPEGGKVSREKIREAVHAVVSARLKKVG